MPPEAKKTTPAAKHEHAAKSEHSEESHVEEPLTSAGPGGEIVTEDARLGLVQNYVPVAGSGGPRSQMDLDQMGNITS